MDVHSVYLTVHLRFTKVPLAKIAVNTFSEHQNNDRLVVEATERSDDKEWCCREKGKESREQSEKIRKSRVPVTCATNHPRVSVRP